MNKVVIIREEKKRRIWIQVWSTYGVESWMYSSTDKNSSSFWSEWRVEFPKGRTPISMIVSTFLSFSNNSYYTSGEYIKDRHRY